MFLGAMFSDPMNFALVVAKGDRPRVNKATWWCSFLIRSLIFLDLLDKYL